MLMGSKPRAVSGEVSKKMLIVIVGMLAIILLPVIIVSVPFSKVVITITNTDTQESVTGYISVYGTNYINNDVLLLPGDEQVLSYSLKAGTYHVYIYYSFQNEQYYYGGRTFSTYVSLSMFETEEVQIDLAR